MANERRWTRRLAMASWLVGQVCLVKKDVKSFALFARASSTASSESRYKTVQVQVIHRHGDRSPITPLKDVEYWESQLVPRDQLERIAQGTEVLRSSDSTFSHNAGGKGVFGKLTQLGLLQMIDVGLKLRDDLKMENQLFHSPLFDPKLPIRNENVAIFSTDFPRTIQSVQGLLVGLFDTEGQPTLHIRTTADDEVKSPIVIDVRHTKLMIPDPQPRETKEQERLEAFMMSREHVVQKESEYLGFARRVSEALHPLLGPGAHEVVFGVDEPHSEKMSIEQEPLAWNQLSEITKCLQSRDLLPPEISKEDVEIISKHTAWRWIDTMSHPRLVYLAMHKFLEKQLGYMLDYKNQPSLIIWSGHDSTLLGLLSAYRLEQPSAWPPYSSTLVIELFEDRKSNIRADDNSQRAQLFVRFSLNGERLRSLWDPKHPLESIPLSLLEEKVPTEGSEATEFAN